MNLFTSTGLLLSFLGGSTIYLASPNQRWLLRPLPAGLGRLAGSVLLVLGWLALWQAMQALTAAFVFLTWLMLLFSLLPYVAAWRRPEGGR